MKRFFSNTLVITGGVLVVAPLIYIHLAYSLTAQIFINRADINDFKFTGHLPDYYFPACLLIGAICIGLGIVFEIKDRNINKPL
jgi:hypothetical protein